MEKNLFEKIKKTKEDQEMSFTILYNNGKIEKNKRGIYDKFDEDISSSYRIQRIWDLLNFETSYYAKQHFFNKIDMKLRIGLIFNKSDLDKKKQVKENVNPYDGIVYFVAEDARCYLNNKQINKLPSCLSEDGIISYDYLIKAIKESGLDYECPDTFEEFKEALISGKTFNDRITADFTKNQKETKPVQKAKSKIRSLFKRN